MYAPLMLVLFAACADAFRSVPPDACEVVARTDAGRVCGRLRTAERQWRYASFRGLPYAQPPVGARRFAQPEPVEPWEYLLDAREDGPACPQKDILYGRIAFQPRGQSEDCLYLNIHVPHSDFPKEPLINGTGGLPILVMVHGGGFQVGSGLTDLHGPEYLMTQKVVVVTLNYRLNVFGFLSLGNKKVPGNQGLRDILAALRWVQRNARAFGGDPDNVTLMGQSCGATAVHLLALSKVAEGLFQRIFLMSGHAIPIYYASNPEFAKQISSDFLKRLNINATDLDQIHQSLVTMPLEDIMYANNIIQYDYGLTSFVPVEEENYPGIEIVLDRSPLVLMAQGRGSQYPMILGYTTDEAETFKWVAYVSQLPQRVEKNAAVALPLRINYAYPDKAETLANDIVEKCFHGEYTLDNFVDCYSNMFFKYPITEIAKMRGSSRAPTYLYRYSYESTRSMIKEGSWLTYKRAAHVEDLTYVFRTNSILGDYVSFPPQTEDDRMKSWWVTLVTNFMKCNNPTCSSSECDWPPVDRGQLQYQDISRPMEYQMKTLDEDEADWLHFFESVDWQVSNITAELRKHTEA